MKFQALLLSRFLSALFTVSVCFGRHNQTGFQADRSMLTEEELSIPFPLKHRYSDGENNWRPITNNPKAILKADKATLGDNDNVNIFAEMIEIETTEKDYFAIQCGPSSDPDDILDGIHPSARTKSFARVHILDLTFLRCDYTFSYIHVNDRNSRMVLGSITLPSSDPPTTPKQVHLVYGGDPTKMRVMYVSSSTTPAPSAKFWKAGASEEEASLSLFGTSATYKANDMCERRAIIAAQNLFRDPGFTHTVEMGDLEPDTRYHYRVGNDRHGWSQVFNFLSAPNTSRGVRFLAFGDQDIHAAGQNTARYVEREIQDRGSEFTLHIGDLGYGMGKGWVWDYWGTMVSHGAALAPYMVSVGNHEFDHLHGTDPSGEDPFLPWWWTNGLHASQGECGVPTLVRWASALPDNGNKFWYSFNWANVHVVMMSSEHDWQKGSKQFVWMDQDLAAVNRTTTPWVVVTAHRPIYTTQRCEVGDYVVSRFMRHNLDPLFEKHKVNLALVAHTHSYERTCLIRNGECVRSGGTQHITVGSAGASLEPCGFSPTYGPYTEAHTNQWGYLRLETSEESIRLEFVLNEDGSVWDSYEVLPWEDHLNVYPEIEIV